MMKVKNRRKGGFTLLELLAVLLIIGICIAVAFRSVSSSFSQEEEEESGDFWEEVVDETGDYLEASKKRSKKKKIVKGKRVLPTSQKALRTQNRPIKRNITRQVSRGRR